MGKSGIPDRWRNYKPMGSVIPGTRFLACKVPLKEALLRSLPLDERFGPDDLKKAFPNIGLLIDLTNTDRYYVKTEFTRENIEYEKILCPGHVLPPNSIVKRFSDVVNNFIETHQEDPEAVIAVHCTHGVNRTGYFICRYMIENMNIPPDDALLHFQGARGHEVERQNYVKDLKNGCNGGSEKDLKNVNQRFVKRKRDSGFYSGMYPDKPSYNTHKIWRSNDSEPETFKRITSGNYAMDRDQIVYERDASRNRMSCDQVRDNSSNRWRIKDKRNGYNPNTYSNAYEHYQPPQHQRVLPNGGRNVESDSRGDWGEVRESQKVLYRYGQKPSRPKFQKHKFRSAHQNRVSNEGSLANSDLPGSWIEEKRLRLSDSTPLRNEDLIQEGHFKNQQSLSKLHLNSRPYENKAFNGGIDLFANPAGPMEMERHRGTADITPSVVDQSRSNRQHPTHNVLPDPDNRQGKFPHPYVPKPNHGHNKSHGQPPVLQEFDQRPGPSHPHGFIGPGPGRKTHYRNAEALKDGQHQQTLPYYTSNKTVYNAQNHFPNSAARNVELTQGLPRNAPETVRDPVARNARGFRRSRRR
uniref:Uncharacterized protein n=2 Tax=Homalodisca liturata TaxID=320908 RepID=A0A1B6J1W6_9HEMI